MAVFIGLYFGTKFISLGEHVTGSLAYAITYFMYAVMISSGLVVHCLFLVECGAQSTSKVYIYNIIAGKLLRYIIPVEHMVCANLVHMNNCSHYSSNIYVLFRDNIWRHLA